MNEKLVVLSLIFKENETVIHTASDTIITIVCLVNKYSINENPKPIRQPQRAFKSSALPKPVKNSDLSCISSGT